MLNCRLFSMKIINIAAASGVAIFFIFDRALKQIALSLDDGAAVTIIQDWLSFSLTTNYRIALSLPLQGAWLNYVIALIIIILTYQLARTIRNKNHLSEGIALGAIILGAISNLSDRIRLGYVVDYLELSYLTAFNLSDLLISAGALYLIIRALRKK